MEIFNMRRLNANKQIEQINATCEVEIPMKAREVARRTNAAAIGSRLSYFETSHPEIGSPKRDVIGMKSRIVPNSASLYLKAVLIVGIREAQVAKQKPERKKKILRATRCLVLGSIVIINREDTLN
jgi:hypothetical protein